MPAAPCDGKCWLETQSQNSLISSVDFCYSMYLIVRKRRAKQIIHSGNCCDHDYVISGVSHSKVPAPDRRSGHGLKIAVDIKR